MRIEDKLWARALVEWYRRLKDFHPAAIARAFDSPPGDSKEFMPSVHQMLERCEYFQKNLAHKIGIEKQLSDSEPYSEGGAERCREIISGLTGAIGMDD